MNIIKTKPESRRQFLKNAASYLTLAGSAFLNPLSTLGQSTNLKVRSVDAYPIYINERSEGLLDSPNFLNEDDPARWRFGGPFEQLPSAIITIIKTNEGLTGFGMGAGGSAAVEIINGHLKHFLINTNPLNVEQLWDQMYTSSVFYGRRGIFAMALSSVDNALWDIAGKYADKPVYQLLGGSERDRIEIYQTNGDFLEAQRRGVKNFKRTTYGGPRTPPDTLDRFVTSVLEARDQLGPDVRLMTDCVSRDGTVEWAIAFCKRLREANLYFMEELLSPDNVFGYAKLRKKVGLKGDGLTRIACGEHEYTEHGFKVLVGLDSADILQPDITWCGGTTAGRRISAIVEDAGLELIPHRGASSWGFPIALTSPSCNMAESFPEGSAILDAMSCQVENGYVVAPTKPGFGHSLTEKMVLDFQLTRRI